MPSTAAAPDARTENHLAFAGLSLAVLLSTLNTSIVNVALPTLARVFHVSTSAAQWSVIAFVLAITALIVGAGRLADLVGRKRLLLVGLALFTVAAGACAAAPGLGWLIAARFFQGLGAAVMMALSVALIGDLTPPERAGRVMGLLGSMSAIGTALGPALGGGLIAAFGWRSIFLLNLPLGLAAFALVFRHVPAARAASGARWKDFDALGTVLLATSLSAYAFALTRRPGGFGAANVVLLTVAAGGLIGFVRTQRRRASPLLQLELLADRSLRSGLGMSLLVASVMMSTLVVGPFYLSQALGVREGALGLVLAAGPLMAALVAGPAGRVVDRIGPRRTTIGGLLGATGGCLGLTLLPETCGVAGYVIPVTLMTAGYSVFQTANNTSVMHAASPARRGVISGLLNLSRNLGLVTGASLLGGVFAFVTGDAMSPSPALVALGTRATFALATVFLGVALVFAWRAPAPALPTATIAPFPTATPQSQIPAKSSW